MSTLLTTDPSASPSPSTSTAPSLTSSAATAPATDGLAAYACTNGSYLYSGQPSGYAYIEHCHTMYAFNQPSIFSVPAGNIDGLGSSVKYSLQACVDGCDDWNAANPDADAPCRAVSYYANLTYVFGVHAEW